MGTSRSRTLRDLALAHRRAADRLVLLRLRMARSFVDAEEQAGSPGPEVLQDLHETWTGQIYGRIGALSTRLRSGSTQLADAARDAERAEGSRMGGYRGAGYLGAGDAAERRARHLAQSLAARSSAQLGQAVPPWDGAVLPASAVSHAVGSAGITPTEDDEGQSGR